jgi:hypothetical protein
VDQHVLETESHGEFVAQKRGDVWVARSAFVRVEFGGVRRVGAASPKVYKSPCNSCVLV